MPLLNLVVILIIVGGGLYLVNRYIPMASSIKSILNVVVVVAVCVWLLQVTGMWTNGNQFPAAPVKASCARTAGDLTFSGRA